MRTLLATATALTVGLVLTSGLRADDKDNAKDNKDSQSNGAQTRTIHGIVAGVTVEGETAIDYQSNKAVMLEAAYLTVVGSPGHGHQGGEADHNRGNRDQQNADNNSNKTNDSNRTDNDNHGNAHGGRHNVYLVWLSPKTKVCEASQASHTGGNDNANAGNKKECSLDKLEVGDRVEIQMTSRSESSSNNQGTPTEEMRKKHGRNRIYVGDATEITILAAPRDNASSGSQDDAKNDGDKDSNDKDNKNNSDKNNSEKNEK